MGVLAHVVFTSSTFSTLAALVKATLLTLVEWDIIDISTVSNALDSNVHTVYGESGHHSLYWLIQLDK